jgi:hypothetical protein
MSQRNIEPELRDFFNRAATPEPSAGLRKNVADARTADHGRRSAIGGRFAADSRLGLSLVALAASVVLSAGLLFVAYGRGGFGGPGLADGATATAATSDASASPSQTDGPEVSASAQSSAGPSSVASYVASASPTHDSSATLGPAGKFVAVGATSIGPSYSVLLPDGRVFVTDGIAVQIFDPATNKFGKAGKLVVPHVRGSVTGLPDGTVLIAGGMDTVTGAGLATALVYDPKTGRETPTGSLAQARFDQRAVALADGRVLVMGGDPGNQTALRTAEIYDPASGEFSQAGTMVVGRACATTVLMSDGKVLIAGGDYPYLSSETTAEVFDPATGKFTATGSMSFGRECAAGALLPDGRILVAGGDSQFVGVGTAEVYDPAGGKFTRTGNMAIGRFSHNATTLVDGRVLLTGGLIEPGLVASIDPSILAVTDNSYLASAELYDPYSGKFTKIKTMLSRRVGQTATLLRDGRVLLAGGNLDKTTAEVYVP